MCLNKFIISVIIVTNIIACRNKITDSISNNYMIDFIMLDTIYDGKNVSLVSSFDFEYGRLKMINNFQKDSIFDESNPFIRDLYIGLSVDFNDSIYSHIINLNSSECENHFGVYKGDSIDNIEGFSPLIVKNGTSCFLVMEGYYYGCNGSFCNFGSVLILKFEEKAIQQIYIFGIDKTIYSLSRMEASVLDDGCLSLCMYSTNNDFLDLIFKNKIEFKNKSQLNCELPGIFCIR